MGMHRHPKYRLASTRQESLMGSVLCAAASFCWTNCPASCRFLGGSVCLGDMAALEDERLKEQGLPERAMRLILSSEWVTTQWVISPNCSDVAAAA